MAIRVARCLRCGVLALVCGTDATAKAVADRQKVWIDSHRTGDNVSCSGSLGSYEAEQN